jgi:tRNA-dihydrouridine synthase A
MSYARTQTARGTPLRAITRHMLGLYHGQSNGRLFRRILSGADKLQSSDVRVLEDAFAVVEPRFSEEATV